MELKSKKNLKSMISIISQLFFIYYFLGIMSIGSKIANYFHVTAVLGSAGLFGYLSWCLGYNFYLNWNTQVKLSDVCRS